MNKAGLLETLHASSPEISTLLSSSSSLDEARNRLFSYLDGLEQRYFNVSSPRHLVGQHIIERNIAKECIRVLKNIIRTENEKLTGFSALQLLWNLFRKTAGAPARASEGFLCEIIALLRGMHGKAGIIKRHFEFFGIFPDTPKRKRFRNLDTYARSIQKGFSRFSCALEKQAGIRQLRMQKKILAFFRATDADWTDYHWHFRNTFCDCRSIAAITALSPEETVGLREAERLHIPVQITPHYLSLFNETGPAGCDRAIRAQVLPSVNYCRQVSRKKNEGQDLDFMGEKQTSPVPGITRRYPQIAIFKPYDTCPQICVYCQRNWELRDKYSAHVSRDMIIRALSWIRRTRTVREILITGGDPLMLSNELLEWIIAQLAAMKHIERIRIGTRVLVTVPYRIDDGLLELIGRYHLPGRREIALVTHFEHPSEITQASVDAVTQLKRKGIGVYNQQVLTYYNSRRFETAFLRRTLKLCGIDPYYSFNTKGKEETDDFRVPIARLEQERKEEARLLPGLDRTDEPVFNVPLLGKSHLRAWQDHEPVMVFADGRRVYRFFPWESRLSFADDYLYTDVSIYEYLKRLDADGEKSDGYCSIFYYF